MNTDIWIEEHEKAAGKAARAELVARLLANKTPKIEQIAFKRYYSQVIPAISEHFDAHLSLEEKQILEKSIVLRNKVIHSELKELANASSLPLVPVRKFTIEGDANLETISAMAEGKISFEVVHDLSFEQGGVFGWLVTNGSSGVFRECYSTLSRVISILTRLAEL